jgi:DNA (cytosine-5)-methyltransferase 1
MTKFKEWNINGTVDLLVGGTPCQSFSVAGLRQGLKDPRGNLMLTYLAIAEHLRPRYIVWENVFGVLSSNGGKDFGSFLGGLGELGYGWAYRVLDAQWCRTHRHPRAVPQRRRRVFVVGCLGNPTSAAKVLFESESMQRYSAPRRTTRQGTAVNVEESVGSGGDKRWPAQVASTLNASFGDKQGLEDQHALNGAPCFVADIPKFVEPIYCGSNPNICDTVTSKWQKQSGGPAGSECGLFVLQPVAIQATVIGRKDHNGPSGSGCSDNGEMFTLNSTDVHAVAMVNMQGSKSNACVTEDGSSYTINAMHGHDVHAVAVAPQEITAFQSSELRLRGTLTNQIVAPTLKSETKSGDTELRVLGTTMQVRRLTPTECERLQGFPDGWTAIPWKKKSADQCPDGPRYKALGNSMAVNCMEWLGERIQAVESGTL